MDWDFIFDLVEDSFLFASIGWGLLLFVLAEIVFHFAHGGWYGF